MARATAMRNPDAYGMDADHGHKTYDFTLAAKCGKWSTFIDPKAQYGYFEHDVYGEGGGLWFERKRLVDADGTSSVPTDVVKCIRKLGFTVPVEFA